MAHATGVAVGLGSAQAEASRSRACHRALRGRHRRLGARGRGPGPTAVSGGEHLLRRDAEFSVGSLLPRHGTSPRWIGTVGPGGPELARTAHRTVQSGRLGPAHLLAARRRAGRADRRGGAPREMTLRLLRPRGANRITIHRDYGRLPPIEAVGGHLNQVLMNLWIRTVAGRTSVSISIRDDGVGIAAEHLHRIFDPFFTTEARARGRGSVWRSHTGSSPVTVARSRSPQRSRAGQRVLGPPPPACRGRQSRLRGGGGAGRSPRAADDRRPAGRLWSRVHPDDLRL
jgi:hypothetical protein